jgi:SAM-dependent methyltransferase
VNPRYILDRDAEERRRRLRLLERTQDPATVAYLERIGVAAGWHCLELGGGAGSIAAWLARRVGPEGRVVATDTDPALLRVLDLANLEVRKHDVAEDGLEPAAFELVHARNLLIHVSRREEVLRKMIGALKPGGWILVEELDASGEAADPSAGVARRELYERVLGAIFDFVGESGIDTRFGARLPALLRASGLRSVRAEGRIRFFRGGPEGPASPHLSAFDELRERVVASGRVGNEEFGAFLALADDPEFAWREGPLVSAWGQRPPSAD